MRLLAATLRRCEEEGAPAPGASEPRIASVLVRAVLEARLGHCLSGCHGHGHGTRHMTADEGLLSEGASPFRAMPPAS